MERAVSRLAYYIQLASNGTGGDIDLIFEDLNPEMSFKDSRFIDYALSLVNSPAGVERIVHHLFNGTQVQRNYCTLFFNRRCYARDWDLVKKAYTLGLIDRQQAFSK
jgi:hypothetical protein